MITYKLWKWFSQTCGYNTLVQTLTHEGKRGVSSHNYYYGGIYTTSIMQLTWLGDPGEDWPCEDSAVTVHKVLT